MLRSTHELQGYRLKAMDGLFGTVRDFYFDAATWHIRYFVVDTGPWLEERDVLIAPAAVHNPEWLDAQLPVDLTKEEIENSPVVAAGERVTRQKQRALSLYFGWPIYQGNLLGATVGAPVIPVEIPEDEPAAAETTDANNLQSLREMTRYKIQATDGEVGHVVDAIVDDEHWVIRYLVVDTSRWLPGRKVVVAPSWVREISRAEHKVSVDMTCDLIRHSPHFDPSIPVNRDYEGHLCDYYGRPKYWEDQPAPVAIHYPCRFCGRRFISKLERNLHQQNGCVDVPPRPATHSESFLEKIENLRPTEHGGYSESSRSR